MLYKRFFSIVGIDNEAAYLECTQKKGHKFTYNIAHRFFFGLSLDLKYLCKYFLTVQPTPAHPFHSPNKIPKREKNLTLHSHPTMHA